MPETTHARLIEDIKTAGRNRNYRRAVELCTELLSRTDRYPEALLYLGRSYHALKEYDRALDVFQFFLKARPDHPVGLFFLGRTYAALGFYRKSVVALRKVIERDPAFAPALSFLGLASLKLKRTDQAIVYFEQALKAEPGNPRIQAGYLNALLVHGIHIFYRRDLEGAARVFEFLAAERPEDILPRLYLAIIARELENYPAALLYYDEALRLSGGDPVFRLHKADILRRMGREEDGRRELKQAKGAAGEPLTGSDDPRSLLKSIALTHFKHGQFREAIYFGKKVLKGDYRDVEMHIVLAESYRHFGDLAKARNHFERAAETDRSRADVFRGLAGVLWERGDFRDLLALCRRRLHGHPDDSLAAYYEALSLSESSEAAAEAIPLLQDQIRLRGDDPELFFSLGRAYADSGRPEPAGSWLERALALAPGHDAALLLLDETYEALGNRAGQITVLETYCGRHPDEIELRKKQVRLLLEEARFGEAAAGLEKLITREPGNRSLRRALGMAYIRSRRFADAYLVWKELITRDPKSVPALRQLIFCLVRLKKLDMAVLVLEKAVRFFKKETSLLLPLGVLYARTRAYEKANALFRELLSLNPRDWRACHNLGMLARRTGNRALAENFLERAREYRERARTAPRNAGKKRPGPKA